MTDGSGTFLSCSPGTGVTLGAGGTSMIRLRSEGTLPPTGVGPYSMGLDPAPTWGVTAIALLDKMLL